MLWHNESLIIGEKAFGHAGAGGRPSFGYTMNRQGHGIMINHRGQSIVDECYQALGYRSDKGGVWTY